MTRPAAEPRTARRHGTWTAARLRAFVCLLLALAATGLAGAPGGAVAPRGAGPRAAPAAVHGCGPALREIRVDGLVFCTVGEERLPPPPPRRDGGGGRAVACIGDGVSGTRFEALYLHEDSQPSRFAEFEAPIQGWIADMDRIYETSAQITGGHRRVRLVTDAACLPAVRDVAVPAGSLDSFGATIRAVRQLGYTDADRNYLMFADADVLCAVSTIRDDSSPGPDNRNNAGGGYVRLDRSCWNGLTAAHETMHTLGGVQLDAPNSTGAWHCTDERDVMCYSDQGPGIPPMRQVCVTGIWALGEYFDCAEDDYFDTSPDPGSYLADHWNTADSVFLDRIAPEFIGAISASPDSGTVGERVDLRIGRFPPFVEIAILFDDIPLERVTSDRDGNAEARVVVPPAVGGPHIFVAKTGDLSISTRFEVTQRITAPARVRAGRTFPVDGTGFEPREEVALSVGEDVLVRVAAREDGTFAAAVPLPAGAPPGPATLRAEGDSGSSAETALEVRPPKGGRHRSKVSDARRGDRGRRAGRRR